MNIIKQDQPKGVYLLFFVEMWERFAYYGMRALLVLYMVETLLFSVEKSSQIYGLYTGLVYLTPILGGYIADRFLGQRKCISIGTILMCIGLFLLAFGGKFFFLTALSLMVIANGFFKSNISSVLGLLYGDDNSKKDSGYTIFYMGINLGAFFSPLVCATLAAKFGYEYGFAAAGTGMLAGALIYKFYQNKFLGNCGILPSSKIENEKQTKLTKHQKNRIFALFALMFFTIAFWICFEQAGSSLTLFAQYCTNRTFLGHNIPTGYFQSLNPLYIIIFAPFVSLLWTYLRSKKQEPSSVTKFVIALFLMSFAFIIMAIAGNLSAISTVSPLWLVIVYCIMTMSELCISPIGLSLVSKLAPVQFLSVLMGSWFLTCFFGNLLAGFLGGKYGTISNAALFLILAGISSTAAIILLLFVPIIKKSIGKI